MARVMVMGRRPTVSAVDADPTGQSPVVTSDERVQDAGDQGSDAPMQGTCVCPSCGCEFDAVTGDVLGDDESGANVADADKDGV